ncbi:MAG: hypothetical protein P8L44_13255 [Opitutales bacterium]|nr:hypothetical protein [Opitutales bacterium]
MKLGHLLFPILFFAILISGAVWVMRTVEEVSRTTVSPTVYLDANGRDLNVTAEMVGSTREKAHQAFGRFGDLLVVNEILSVEEQENLQQILQLGEAHWGEENWAPAFYSFERVLNELNPLIDEGLGQERATEMEARYTEFSQSLSSEIILVESTYLQAIEMANEGYNALISKDWIVAIQTFAKALDTLNLVKAQSSEILNNKFNEAYDQFEQGNLDKASALFNDVLTAIPDSEDAMAGLQLIETERSRETELLESELVLEPDEELAVSVPEETDTNMELTNYPLIVEADRHYERRELKESLKLYFEVRAKAPGLPGLDERIFRARKALRNEEVTRLMDRAAILADLGQWDTAVKTYRHILNVDPVHREARIGWEEALIQLVGKKQVEQYRALLKHHLEAREFIHARSVMIEAQNVLQNRKDFDEHFLTLSTQLESQLKPLEVTVESDGETWVCIPGKLAPEQFKEKRITIFPGNLNLIGWRKGFESSRVSLAFNLEDAPESVSIECQARIKKVSYSKKAWEERVNEALRAHHLEDLLVDTEGFIDWFQSEPKANMSLSNDSQVATWDESFYTNLYTALTQEAGRKTELIDLEARGQYLQVPVVLSRQETIELGQYLASLD